MVSTHISRVCTVAISAEAGLGMGYSKRGLLARAMQVSGFTSVLERYGSRPGLLVINHHRIGNASRTRFDREVFSATTEQMDWQIGYLKRRFALVGADEVVELVQRRKPLNRMFVCITFDDGYRDNYCNAFPVLRSHNATAIFFLVPAYVGTATIPWWDEIAYLVRNSPARTLSLQQPAPLTISLEGDRESAIHTVLQHYKRTDNTSPDEFMRQLRSAAGCELPQVKRRFLNWDEAREMERAGMTIGSHTATHRILSQLPAPEQGAELVESRTTLEGQLAHPIETCAYPVGIRSSFDLATEEIAAAAGYQCCFSFYGGVNRDASFTRPMDVLRTSVEPDPLMFRNQVAMLSRLDALPY